MAKGMNLFSDDNPKTTLKGLCFKNKIEAIKSIEKINNYFNQLENNQIVPGKSSEKLLPIRYLNNRSESKRFYKIQAMWRVIALMNRVKVFLKNKKLKQVTKKDFEDSLEIFKEWMDEYHKI